MLPNIIDALANAMRDAFQLPMAALVSSSFQSGRECPKWGSRDAVQQRLTRLPRGSIEHRTLFRTIANSDMGFEPHLAKSLNFYGRSTAQCFYMYDDRGCVVAGAPFHQEALVERFGDWVIQWF